MTWSEFVVKVKDLMPVESVRLNTQTYLTALIRQSVKDIQDQIIYYREGHQTFYTDDDVVLTNLASVGNLPDQAQIVDAFVVVMTGANCCRTPVTYYPWGNRHDLICGHVALTDKPCLTIDPYAKEFTMFPALDEDTELELNYDGIKLDFDDDDDVPFDEDSALVVSYFCLAHIYRKVRNDINMYQSFMNDYVRELRRLYVRKKDLRHIRETGASWQPDSTCAECECNDEQEAYA